MGRHLATEMAPPFVLVAHYFIAGAFFYILTSATLPFFADFINSYFLSSELAGMLHMYLLGFVMMIIFGAMYQLVPVVLEIPIFSKDFAYIQFYLYISGIALFVFSLLFENYHHLMAYGAVLLYVSMLIFTVNVFLTYKNIEKWTIVAKFILAANIFLFIGITIGFFIALNLIHGFYQGDILPLVQAHIASTISGFVMMITMGVGMVLLPMFGLSHNFSEKPITYAFYAITTGLALFIVFLLIDIALLRHIGLFLVVASIFLALYQMMIIYKKRVKKTNDFWSKNMIASFIFLAFSIILIPFGFFIESNVLSILFGFMLFFGFFVFFIVGHIYKILPFLVWYQRYSPLVGKQKVPMLHDMISTKVADWQFWITMAGTTISAIAIAFGLKEIFTIGSFAMGVGALFVLYNIYYTLTYGLKESF